MIKNSQKNKSFFIIFLILIFLHNGCSTLFSSKEEKKYYKIMSEKLQQDWQSQEKIPTKRSLAELAKGDYYSQSQCHKTHEFERYTIQKDSIYVSGAGETVAIYCPKENRYWVEWCGGDLSFLCLSYGPYNFNR